MALKIQKNCTNIDWGEIPKILKAAGMASHSRQSHQKAFENSQAVVFIFDMQTLIGFGRAISDGAYQAAIYDVAVLPAYQGKGIGKTIIKNILAQLPKCNCILYSAPGKERFYEKLSFRKMKTGMALFLNTQKMKTKGFTE